MCVAGHWHEGQRQRLLGERRDDLIGVLVGENADYQVQRFALGDRGGERAGGLAIVRAVDPGRAVADRARGERWKRAGQRAA